MEPEFLHIQWEGPFDFAHITTLNNPAADRGIYQVYGRYPVYGEGALLYIGQTRRTFATRLQEEGWQIWQTSEGTVQFYVGRLSGALTPNEQEWHKQIVRVERLLIFAHCPARNAKGLYGLGGEGMNSLHVPNWGTRGRLLPEVSGARWSNHFSVIPGYAAYGEHGERKELD